MESTTFTELWENIEVEGVNNVAIHPLFREIALGTMSMQRFQRYIQQNHLWSKKFFPNYIIMADKEVDSERKKQLNSYSADSCNILNLMTSYYTEFDFQETTKAETYTQNYINFLRNAALDFSVGESIAAFYPAVVLGHRMGLEITKIANLEGNAYYRMVNFFTLLGTISLQKFETLINDYYKRASEQEKRNMRNNFSVGVQMEIDFNNGVYRVV